MTKEDVRKLAEEHWEFLEKRGRIDFMDGMTHGYKHAEEEYKAKIDKFRKFLEDEISHPTSPKKIREKYSYIFPAEEK